MAKLENYLETYRKRTGLSQKEVAFLLGAQSGAKVCRYERFWELPQFKTLMSYERLFGAPVRQLFAGATEKNDALTLKRIQDLIEQLEAIEPNAVTQQKLAFLKARVAAAEPGFENV
jgi:transcriptional regulator with XRE-family HTH domain